MRRHTRVTLTKEAQDSKGFQAYMIDRWGYTHEEARKLTQDRKAYYCLVIENAKNEVIGILYCDSNVPSAFPVPEVSITAEGLLPFFKELLGLRGV